MKNISLLVVFLMVQALSQTAFGQGNLQFNKTRLINFTSSNIFTPPNTNAIIYDSTNFIVPSEKTLKIENIYGSMIQNGAQLGQNFFIDNFPITVNNLLISIDDVVVKRLGGGGEILNDFPIWLPAGTYKLKIYGNSFPDNVQRFKVIISALEFNIIP